MSTRRPCHAGPDSGLSLVEVLIALFLLAVGALATAPMFVHAMRSSASGADLGTVGAVAVERMELLRGAHYRDLDAGGSLTSNVTVDGIPYFDLSNPDHVVRWEITDNPVPGDTKTIAVRVISGRQVVGRKKEAVVTTLRGSLVNASSQKGFGLVEVLVSLSVLLLAAGGLMGLLLHNARVNKSQQLRMEAQANARNCLTMVVTRLRNAGWDPTGSGIGSVVLDPDGMADAVNQIEIFADTDEDGSTGGHLEQIIVRHIADRIEWRPTSSPLEAFLVLSVGITNDADGDGVVEPMFVPDASPDPTRITVQITAASPIPDPLTGEPARYTVSSVVALRRNLI